MPDNYVLETFVHEGYEIEIWQDIDVGDWNNPRVWEPLGHMICAHSRYELGDEQINSSDYNSWEEIEQELKNDPEVLLWIPLYLYDHGGITMSTKPFSCGWDSGQVGFIYMTHEAATNFNNVEDMENCLLDEVKTYSAWLEGDVVGYFVKDSDGEILDSCGGYVGDYDYCVSEAKNAATYHRKAAAIEEERKYEFACRDIITV
jgi:hypothetical protein